MRAQLMLGALAWAGIACAQGDAARGASLYESRCTGCHSVQADRIGPRHQGVVGRKAGSVSGFDYSDALKAAPFNWDVPLLQRWLADPEALVPGQRMGFSVAEVKDRADITAYLATLKP